VGVDWSHRGDYIVGKHGVTPAEADAALADPDRVVIDPDYNSNSGRGVRNIGYCPTRGELLTVLTLTNEGTVYGVNAWASNVRDKGIYQEANSEGVDPDE
jgi:uncharacterized DUF497 family protein